MAVYTFEEIIDMADRLKHDIREANGDIDIVQVASFVDRCTDLIKNLAEATSLMHQQIDVLTEKK